MARPARGGTAERIMHPAGETPHPAQTRTGNRDPLPNYKPGESKELLDSCRREKVQMAPVCPQPGPAAFEEIVQQADAAPQRVCLTGAFDTENSAGLEELADPAQ